MKLFEKIESIEPRTVMTIIMTVAVLLILVLVFTVEIPETNRDLAIATVGTFVGYFGGVITFWFGTSKGSADKQKELNKRSN